MSRRPTRSTLSDTLLPYTTLCRSKKTFSVHVFRRLETRCLQYSGGNINIGYHLLHPGAWFYDRWGVSQHGYFHRFLISRPFVNQSMRSEEHTSELQSLMRISYAVFCLKKKTKKNYYTTQKRL